MKAVDSAGSGACIDSAAGNLPGAVQGRAAGAFVDGDDALRDMRPMALASFLLRAFLLVFLTAAPAAGEAALKKATFLPHWTPQAQFAGYYTALEKGFYREAGIDLEILFGGPATPVQAHLGGGFVDFASMWLSAGICMRAEGIPIVNLAQLSQRSALMLVAKSTSGIAAPQQMDGKKIGLWGNLFQIQPMALFRKYGISVKVIRQSQSINLFLRGGVDVASAMWYNEYHRILNAGIDPEELNSFFFQDYGLNFPEDGIYALEDTVAGDPAMCRAFAAASLKGWQYAFAHRDEAVQIVMDELARQRIPATVVHQRWMLDRMADLMQPRQGSPGFGGLNQGDYFDVGRRLVEYGAIDRIPPFRVFHRSPPNAAGMAPAGSDP